LSISHDDTGQKTLINCFAGCSVDAICAAAGLEVNDLFDENLEAVEHTSQCNSFKVKIAYPYCDESGVLLYENCRLSPLPNEPKRFLQRRCENGAKFWGLNGTRRVPYRLPELIAAVDAGVREIFLVEGEKDCDNLRDLGFTATSLKNWRSEFNQFIWGLNVTILRDHDKSGIKQAEDSSTMIGDAAASVKIVDIYTNDALPDKNGKDVSDWIDEQRSLGLDDVALAEELARISNAATDVDAEQSTEVVDTGEAPSVALDDFYAYSPTHSYIHVPTREMWSAIAVNSRIFKKSGLSATKFLDRNRAVEQLTWAPGEPLIIENRFLRDGGWLSHSGARCFNLYQSPPIEPGNRDDIRPWLDHLQALYPEEAHHFILWCAYRVQRPNIKINHALVLGGGQGIGKDSLLEPVKYAVGHWNFREVGPHQILGRFNGFLRSVILRISEARDLGDIDRYAFYERMKTITAAPPDVLMIDEKNQREYAIPNLTGVIITTNHPDSIHLPLDDRRHFIAWSERTRDEFTPEYWQMFYKWLNCDGRQNVAAYLRTLDISSFDPKYPPPRTPAWQQIVDSGRAPEDAELADVLESLQTPKAVTLMTLVRQAPGSPIAAWLEDRKNRRTISHRLAIAGYVQVRNDAANDGLWKIYGKRQAVYARRELTLREQMEAARELSR